MQANIAKRSLWLSHIYAFDMDVIYAHICALQTFHKADIAIVGHKLYLHKSRLASIGIERQLQMCFNLKRFFAENLMLLTF